MDKLNETQNLITGEDDRGMLENESGTQLESKSERFKRLASKRVNATMKQIELIGNLSSGSYEYSEEQVSKIFDTLQESLDSAKAKFSKTKQTKEAFSFD